MITEIVHEEEMKQKSSLKACDLVITLRQLAASILGPDAKVVCVEAGAKLGGEVATFNEAFSFDMQPAMPPIDRESKTKLCLGQKDELRVRVDEFAPRQPRAMHWNDQILNELNCVRKRCASSFGANAVVVASIASQGLLSEILFVSTKLLSNRMCC